MTEQINQEEAFCGVIDYMTDNSRIHLNGANDSKIDFYLETDEDIKNGIVDNLNEHGWIIKYDEKASNPETGEEAFHIEMEAPKDPILVSAAAEIMSEYLDY